MSRENAPTAGAVGDPPVVVPEDDVVFRLAQLLLLLTALERTKQPGVALERLGYYDFLTANPLLVLTDTSDPDRKRLLIAGFDGRALSYASPAQRFTTRRERLQHDLALLVAYGLVTPTVDKSVLYSVTAAGVELAGQFTAIYARSYRLAAEIVLRRLSKLSDRALRESVRKWITIGQDGTRPEALDLLDVTTPVRTSLPGTQSPVNTANTDDETGRAT